MQNTELITLPFDGRLTGSIAGRDKLQGYCFGENLHSSTIVRIENVEGDDKTVEQRIYNLDTYCQVLQLQGIDSVRFIPFFGPRNGNFRKVFLITERVEGKDVVPHITTFGNLEGSYEQIRQLDDLYSLLIDKFGQILNGEESLVYDDFSIYQFMHGHKYRDENDHYIFVDIEPRVFDITTEKDPEEYLKRMGDRLSFNFLQTLRSYNNFKQANELEGETFANNTQMLFELNQYMQELGIEPTYLEELQFAVKATF